jgi:hypothetical protein
MNTLPTKKQLQGNQYPLEIPESVKRKHRYWQESFKEDSPNRDEPYEMKIKKMPVV